MSVKYDFTLGYHKDNLEFIEKLSDRLEEDGYKVWYADPSHTMHTEESGAIMNCKVYLAILSFSSVQDHQMQDSISLAYIANRLIVPVGLGRYRKLSPLLDEGLKLMLARINWACFQEKYEEDESEKFEDTYKQLMKSVFPNVALDPGAPEFVSYKSFINDDNATNFKKDFWERHFEDSSEVSWPDFKNEFITDYGEQIRSEFSEHRLNRMINIMFKEIFNNNKVITKQSYSTCCSANTSPIGDRFFDQLQQIVIGHDAIREVFNMDSSLRMPTIINLGNLVNLGNEPFPAVTRGLLGLLKDDDPNIRVVAAIALSKSVKKKDTEAPENVVDEIMKLLSDKDRLVRESACRSLGAMGATKATTAIIETWRNDPIKDVREGAESALQKMGGQGAEECIKVVHVLAEELASLQPKK